MTTFEVKREETTLLTYSVEAESLADAIRLVDCGDGGEPSETLLGHETVTRVRAMVEDGQIFCPHCMKAGEPTIVEAGCQKWWRGAVLTDDEYGKDVATHGASYEASDESRGPLYLVCSECDGEFDPPEGYGVSWR